MSIWGNGENKSHSRVDNVQVTESSQGRNLTVLMGQGRVHQTLLWTDGLVAWKSDQGGKGGGKGTYAYVYAADVIAALCNGPVSGIGDVWDGQNWLSSSWGHDSYVVTSQAVYSPANAAILLTNGGVVFATTYSQTYNDYGAPAATVLSGTDYSPLVQVPYGTALSTGQYSVNPASIGTFVVTSCAPDGLGNTIYTGTFTGGAAPYASGASNNYVGFRFTIAGFPTNPVNNGTFPCIASSTTTVTLVNPLGVSEAPGTPGSAAETGNSYHFFPGDAGKSAVVSYQYTIQDLVKQEISTIPASGQVTVGGTYNPTYDMGVWYYNTNGGSGPNTMVQMTPVSGTPTAAGQYHFSTPGVGSTGGATYTFYTAGGSGGDFAQEVLIQWQYQNLSLAEGNSPNLLNFELFGGGPGQAVWPFILTGGTSEIGNQDGGQDPYEPAFPGAALGYSNTAYLAYGPMALGESGEISDITVEVITPYAYGGLYSVGPNVGQAIVDCCPVTCLLAVLTNPVWGLGDSAQPFPASCIDNGPSGTWGGAPGTPGARSTGSTAWNWFAANSFFISPRLDEQETASTVVGKWLEAGMCAAFMSEGLLKLVPYGTQSAAGNGCTWVAPSSTVVALDDTCFVAEDGAEPMQIERKAWADAANKVQIKWCNRGFQYSDELTQESDQGAINRFGLRLEDPQAFDFIATLSAAQFAGIMRVKRSANIKNSYKGVLPFSYSYLEPMDLVNVTTSSVWAQGLNNANLGLVNITLRVTKIVDDPEKGLEVEFEDSLFAAGLATQFNKGLAQGQAVANAYLPPGDSEVVVFEVPNRLGLYQGNQIKIGAVGQTLNWGSTNIWVSRDGVKYQMVGSITAPARLGQVAQTFFSTSDPDTTQPLLVNLAENCGALEAGSTTDADQGNTLCFVDGEIIAYSACAVTALNQYTMSAYIRRGQMGTTIASHPAGSLFLRLDSAVFTYTYDPSLAGQTVYFKFQSVNNFGNCPQDLSTLTALSFAIPGVNGGTVDASTGLIIDTVTHWKWRPGITLQSNGQLVSQLKTLPAIASGAFTAANPLSQSGSTKTITIAASTIQWGSNPVSYNSGSVTPLAYGTFYVYADDPGFGGGAVTYQFTTNPLVLSQSDSRVPFGVITTAIGGGGVGGGGGGDTCFSPDTKIFTQRGPVAIGELSPNDLVKTARGTWRRVLALKGTQYRGPMIPLGAGELVTPGHHIRYGKAWARVDHTPLGRTSRIDYKGVIINLVVEAEPADDGTALDTEHSYTLANGVVAHNIMGTN